MSMYSWRKGRSSSKSTRRVDSATSTSSKRRFTRRLPVQTCLRCGLRCCLWRWFSRSPWSGPRCLREQFRHTWWIRWFIPFGYLFLPITGTSEHGVASPGLRCRYILYFLTWSSWLRFQQCSRGLAFILYRCCHRHLQRIDHVAT